ncbi:hypothetical protein DBIPINDM_008206 (plasmid) [Mesorhizobium sp. AR02]|uniref:hypothetical protein n=1 Tax=Mesorhizobium sp. AR02 TaxID=2865837 RepID=UPI002160E55E|nr:hypothetical protein [Mesorhizobium sp. AR02]UVK57595.1 hypothetical protein DBIPINDM_008206 [Mesorhizobium sp. AR02]
MKLSNVMKGTRLKVKRANSHIDALIRDTAVLPRDLYEVTNGPHYSNFLLAKPDSFALAFRPKEPIPEHFGAIMGDAVNNLREALDYWINAAVRCVGPARKLHFPFVGTGENLVASRHYVAIEKAFPDAAKFIAKDIDPRRDANLPLWAVTGLSNDNKHNDFLPIVSIATVGVERASSMGVYISDGTFGGDSESPFVMIASKSPIAAQKDLKVSAQIAFQKGTVFEYEPVIPTLANMSKVVSQTLDALEKFIAPYCK